MDEDSAKRKRKGDSGKERKQKEVMIYPAMDWWSVGYVLLSIWTPLVFGERVSNGADQLPAWCLLNCALLLTRPITGSLQATFFSSK